MKCLKIFGLAAVAAIALMAFLGASSASATVLCKTTPVSNSCPFSWDYSAGTALHLTIENTIHFVAGPIDDTCTEFTTKGTTATTGSATTTVSGNFQVIKLTCTCPTNITAFGSFEIHWISGTHNGTLTGKGTKYEITCSGITCEYGTAATGTHLGTVTASATSTSAATIDIDAELGKEGGGFLCPVVGELSGNFWITEPKPLYIAQTG